MRYKVMYGPETVNEFDDWTDATAMAEHYRDDRGGTFYVYDSEEDQRWDPEDWQDINPGIYDHLA